MYIWFFSTADPDSPVLDNISTSRELLDYLAKKYLMFHNMTFVQGVFWKCNSKALYNICLEYAKSNEDEVFYFEEKGPQEGEQNFSDNNVNIHTYTHGCVRACKRACVFVHVCDC